MVYRWWWWALEHLDGVEPYEVTQVLVSPRRLPRGGTIHGMPVICVCGRTAAGRPLVVTVRKTADHDQEIIGVREMNPDERAVFEAWEAGRNG